MTCQHESCGQPTGKPYARYCDEHRWRHRGKRPTWRLTPERAAYLREHYRPSERGTSQRCAVALSVPGWRVRRWAAELGLTSGVRANARPWTAEEDAVLQRHLHTRHVGWLARRLKRSVTAVIVRSKRLGLSRLPDGYSQSDVALGFGVSRDTVERWQREGRLTSRFVPREGQPYRFTDEDLVRFVKAHPTAFALGKVEQMWFLDLVFNGWIGERRQGAA